jgi:uncharacterized protein involved in exopolysaccharide biosynthesis
MSATRRSSERRAELEVEQEIDFGRYLRALGRRWWLLVGGLLVGAVLGVMLSLGGGNLYRAKATLYLGQPLAATGTAQIQSVNTNPSTVAQLAHNEDLLSQVAKASGLPLAKLRAGVSTATVSGYLSKQGQTPLVTITVKAKAPRLEVQNATKALASLVLAANSAYPRHKIAALNAQIASYKQELALIDKRMKSLNAQVAAGNLSSLEQQVMLTSATLSEQRRGVVSDELQQAELLLTQARTVEQGSVVGKARAVKTTARSRKNSAIVGGALGLLVGAFFALALPSKRRRAD